MNIAIDVHLDYAVDRPIDILLQVEAANLPEQSVVSANLQLSTHEHFARVPAQDAIGERIWLRATERLMVDYRAEVEIHRLLCDCAGLAVLPPHQLPGETVPYLLSSLYCPADRFQSFVEVEFAGLENGAKVLAMRDWVREHLSYTPGASTSETTAADTFITRKGICRDYAHLLITLARAACVPARIASVYALGVDPPDFHAVAEVFLGGAWYLMDATGMAEAGAMAKIGVGRDAADVAFLTSFGDLQFNAQTVAVQPSPTTG